MRKVIVSFEISVRPPTDSVFVTAKPDFVFQDGFDKDDDISFSKMCDLEYKSQDLVRAFKALGYQVIARKTEVYDIEV